jgi:hypothetical protein
MQHGGILMTKDNDPTNKDPAQVEPEHADFDVDGHMHACLYDTHDTKSECTKDCAAWLYALWTRDRTRPVASEGLPKNTSVTQSMHMRCICHGQSDEHCNSCKPYCQPQDSSNELEQLRETVCSEVDYGVDTGEQAQMIDNIMVAIQAYVEVEKQKAAVDARAENFSDYLASVEPAEAMRLLARTAYLYIMEPTNATNFETTLYGFNRKDKVLGDLRISAQLTTPPKPEEPNHE